MSQNVVMTSRVGRKPISIPNGVNVSLIEDNKVVVKGSKGQLSVVLHPFVNVNISNNEINVSLKPRDKKITGANLKTYRSIAGTTRANINNLVQGVLHGFERKLLLVGVGYRAQAKGKILSLSLGFSHPVEFDVPAGITIETPSQTEIIIKGSDKSLVGEVAAKIRDFRSPEPYKGKGVRYSDEQIVLKETKKK